MTFFRFGSLFASNGLVMKYPMRDILARYGPSDFSAAAVAGAASAAVAAASATAAADKLKYVIYFRVIYFGVSRRSRPKGNHINPIWAIGVRSRK